MSVSCKKFSSQKDILSKALTFCL